MEQLYSKKYVLQALKFAADSFPELNIGATYRALLHYEKEGVIVKPDSIVANTNWRYYTEAQINEIVRRVIAYKQQAQKK